MVVERQHPLRPRRGEERRRRGRRRDRRRPRGGRPVQLDLGLLRAGRLPRGEQEGDRVAGQVRRSRLHRRRRATACCRCSPQAQGSGQKAQQDALLGQGSIFDLEEPTPAAAGRRRRSPAGTTTCPCRRCRTTARARHDGEGDARAVPLEPSAEGGAGGAAGAGRLLARRARRARRTASGSRSAARSPSAKKIRTKKGEPMMFATLDDLEGSVEMLVFNSAYAANADKIGDRQGADRARPRGPQGGGRDQARRPGGRDLRAHPRGGRARRTEAAELAAAPAEANHAARAGRGRREASSRSSRTWCSHNPGDHELMLAVGERRLLLGPDFRVSANSACRAELAALMGVEIARRRLTRAVHPSIRSTLTGAWGYQTHVRTLARVPAVLRVLRPARPPVRLHRGGLPVPLPLRRRAHRPPLHGLHEQGLPRRDRRGGVRGGRAHAPRLRRREDDRPAAAPVQVGVEQAYDGYGDAFDCVNPDFFETPVRRRVRPAGSPLARSRGTGVHARRGPLAASPLVRSPRGGSL